jgi:capsular polysaccharide biosynthesis protein
MRDDMVDLRVVLRSARRAWILLLVVALGAAGTTYTLLALGPQVYRATTTVAVGQALASRAVTNDDLKASQALALMYADVARRQPVLEPVVKHLGLATTWPKLQRRVRVSSSSTSPQLLTIAVESNNRREAVAIAWEVNRQLLAFTVKYAAGSDHTAAFARRQASALEVDITEEERQLERLQQQPPSPARNAAIDLLQRRLLELRQTYTTMVPLAPGGPASVEVIEVPRAAAAPVRPRPLLSAVVVGIVALTLALGAAVCLDIWMRAPRRRMLDPALRPARSMPASVGSR